MSGGWNGSSGDGPQSTHAGSWWEMPAMAATFAVIGVVWFGPAFYIIGLLPQPWKLLGLLWIFAFPGILYMCAPGVEWAIGRLSLLFWRKT
jgi:hypothetical protein